MRLRSFQMRLLLWTWALLLAALGVLFYYSTSLVGETLVAETEARSVRELDAVRWLITQHAPFGPGPELDAWFDNLGSRMGIRVTYIADGKVLADSEVGFDMLPDLEDHSTRPEVVASLKEGSGLDQRYSATLKKEMIYAARKVEAVGGLPDGVLRIAVPFSRVGDRLSTISRNFTWIFLGTLLVAAIVSALMFRNMTRSITSFSEVARDIGEGSYSRRLRAIPGGEFQPLAESVNAMAGSIERHIRTIEDQKGQLQAIFEGMREGVMTLDSEGRIESYNPALKAMFNLPRSTVGRTPIEVTRRYEVQDLAENMLADPDGGVGSAQLDLMDTRTVEVSAVPFMDNKGVRKLIMVFHDITVMKRSERGLKDFVANASHQLRTPLTSIKGYTETLLDNPPEDMSQARGFLETVLKNADHMDKVISSMLALAKSEEMGKALALRPVSAKETMDRAVADVTPWGAERGITVVTTVPDGAMRVMAEPDGLLHVFHNLLNNAVKYSPDNGRITVSAEDDGESIVFCVEDQGPGISRKHSTKVFERFYRVDENTIDGSGSAGLGLAICRRIVKNLGGEIWHDGYGEGTRGARFCFRLNRATV